MQALVGVVALLTIAWLLSERKREVRYVQVVVGLGIQFALAFLLLNVPQVRDALFLVNHLVRAIETATTAGTSLMFGFLGGDPAPYVLEEGANATLQIFAFRVLPQILVFSVIVALLWHWRVLPWVIRRLRVGVAQDARRWWRRGCRRGDERIPRHGRVSAGHPGLP